MLKNLLYAVLFIALVVGLAYLMALYLPAQIDGADFTFHSEITQVKAELGELASLREQVVILSAQVSTLASQVDVLLQRPEPPAPGTIPQTPAVEQPQSLTSYKALLQALNCKYIALNHSNTRLISELALLEDIVNEYDAPDDTLLREIRLARSETAAQIPSAIDRLEIIWKLLLRNNDS